MKKFLLNLNRQFQKRAGKIDKRIRLVISTLGLGLVILFSTFFYFDMAWVFLPVLVVLTYFLTYFSLLEGIEKTGWWGLFFMPVVISVSFYLFYFLIPSRWITRIPFIVFYEISIYASLLCSNIFNVGVEKSLGLYRAAFSINYVYQTIVSFLVINLLLATRSNFVVNGLVCGVLGFMLSLNLLWTIRLKKFLEREVTVYSLAVGVLTMELAILASFLPISFAMAALFITGGYYFLTGLIYNFMDERLFKETIREYVTVFVVILIMTLLTISF